MGRPPARTAREPQAPLAPSRSTAIVIPDSEPETDSESSDLTSDLSSASEAESASKSNSESESELSSLSSQELVLSSAPPPAARPPSPHQSQSQRTTYAAPPSVSRTAQAGPPRPSHKQPQPHPQPQITSALLPDPPPVAQSASQSKPKPKPAASNGTQSKLPFTIQGRPAVPRLPAQAASSDLGTRKYWFEQLGYSLDQLQAEERIMPPPEAPQPVWSRVETTLPYRNVMARVELYEGLVRFRDALGTKASLMHSLNVFEPWDHSTVDKLLLQLVGAIFDIPPGGLSRAPARVAIPKHAAKLTWRRGQYETYNRVWNHFLQSLRQYLNHPMLRAARAPTRKGRGRKRPRIPQDEPAPSTLSEGELWGELAGIIALYGVPVEELAEVEEPSPAEAEEEDPNSDAEPKSESESEPDSETSSPQSSSDGRLLRKRPRIDPDLLRDVSDDEAWEQANLPPSQQAVPSESEITSSGDQSNVTDQSPDPLEAKTRRSRRLRRLPDTTESNDPGSEDQQEEQGPRRSARVRQSRVSPNPGRNLRRSARIHSVDDSEDELSSEDKVQQSTASSRHRSTQSPPSVPSRALRRSTRTQQRQSPEPVRTTRASARAARPTTRAIPRPSLSPSTSSSDLSDVPKAMLQSFSPLTHNDDTTPPALAVDRDDSLSPLPEEMEMGVEEDQKQSEDQDEDQDEDQPEDQDEDQHNDQHNDQDDDQGKVSVDRAEENGQQAQQVPKDEEQTTTATAAEDATSAPHHPPRPPGLERKISLLNALMIVALQHPVLHDAVASLEEVREESLKKLRQEIAALKAKIPPPPTDAVHDQTGEERAQWMRARDKLERQRRSQLLKLKCAEVMTFRINRSLDLRFRSLGRDGQQREYWIFDAPSTDTLFRGPSGWLLAVYVWGEPLPMVSAAADASRTRNEQDGNTSDSEASSALSEPDSEDSMAQEGQEQKESPCPCWQVVNETHALRDLVHYLIRDAQDQVLSEVDEVWEDMQLAARTIKGLRARLLQGPREGPLDVLPQQLYKECNAHVRIANAIILQYGNLRTRIRAQPHTPLINSVIMLHQAALLSNKVLSTNELDQNV